VNVIYSEEAERCIARENAGWSAYADHPLLFEEELELTIESIKRNPKRPVYQVTRRGPVRRALMPKTGNHVYFLFMEKTETVEIVSVAGGKRARGPSFER